MGWTDSRLIGYLHRLQITHDLIQTMPAIGYNIAIDGFTGSADSYPSLADPRSSAAVENSG
eukprot:16316008-Heterocapsa_arctica.AAC.1